MSAHDMLSGLHLAAPTVVVAVAALFLLWYEAVMRRERHAAFPGAFAAAALACALWYDLLLFAADAGSGRAAFAGSLLPDRLGYAAAGLVLAGALLALLAGAGRALRDGLVARDLHAFALLATSGLLVMTQAGDLAVLLVGLETASLSLYAMAGLAAHCPRSREAALKYLIPGAVGTALAAYGAALLFAGTGTLAFLGLRERFAAAPPDAVALAGGALLLAGLLFKVSAAPFHMWTPDVYEGAPTPVTLFMAVAVKAAGFAALLRLVAVAFAPAGAPFAAPLSALALVTMTLGNLCALGQTSLKRLLGWSTVAHAGYLLVALAAVAGAPASLAPAARTAGGALLLYLLAYAFANGGAFACLLLLERRGCEPADVASLSGLAGRHPAAALLFSLFLLSLAGVPPLAGFAAKFAVFYSAARAGFLGLALAGVLNSLLGAYVYLKVAVAMYAGADDGETTARPNPSLELALLFAIAATLYLGVNPEPFLAAFQSATMGY